MQRFLITLLTSLLAFGAGCLLTFWFLGGASKPATEPPRPATATPPDLPATTSPIKQVPAAPPVVTTVAPPPAAPLAPLPAEAQEIIDILRSGYIDAPSLLGSDLSASTLPGIVASHPGTIRIATESRHTPLPDIQPLLAILPGGVGYWRPRRFDDKEIARFTSEWDLWKAADLRGLVIDLRYFRDANNFDGATAVAGLFVSPQKNLFTLQALNKPQKIQRSERQPLDLPARFPVCVLVNVETRGAAEVLAAVLREQAGALLVGSPTAGEGGLYVENRLGSGRYLLTATSGAVTGSGTNLLGHPLVPDIPAYCPGEFALFRAGGTAGPASVLEPADGPEVSRDHGNDTPLDGLDEGEEENASKSIDVPLQAACDAVRGIAATTGGK